MRWSLLVLVADQGRELVGSAFSGLRDRSAILPRIVDVRAPWQKGRAERRGDIFKKTPAKAARLFELVGWA
eukprot:13400925-Alexandrium_andersonii.AAC.1